MFKSWIEWEENSVLSIESHEKMVQVCLGNSTQRIEIHSRRRFYENPSNEMKTALLVYCNERVDIQTYKRFSFVTNCRFLQAQSKFWQWNVDAMYTMNNTNIHLHAFPIVFLRLNDSKHRKFTYQNHQIITSSDYSCNYNNIFSFASLCGI